MIYSPSSREDFSFCPRYWWFRKNNLVTRTIEYPELCAMGGNAVGKAMELWNNARMQGLEADFHLHHICDFAEYWLNYELNKQSNYDRVLGSPKANDFREQLPKLVRDACETLWTCNPIKQYAILGAEEAFPHAGNSRLDVRVKQADGRQIVFDYKVKFGEIEEKWINKEFAKHFAREQRLTYTHLTDTDMFGIILVLLDPREKKKKLPPRVVVRTVSVTEDEKKAWLRDALLMTPEMDHALTIQTPEKVRGRTFPHANQYGECKYSDACLRYQLDADKMSMDYIYVRDTN